jgi:hypothetical protein
MAVDPTKSSGAHPIPGSRIDQPGSQQSARLSGQTGSGETVSAPSSSTDDRVQLSAEARQAGQTESTTSPAGLTTDRLREILKRLTSGYYDSPQVIDTIARKAVDDLGGMPGHA